MILKLDKEKLNTIISDYSRVTGLSIVLMDSSLKVLASSQSDGYKFCKMLQSEDNSYRCLCSDAVILEKCRVTKEAQMHICHAGLCDMAIPIVSEGNVIAYILLGRIRRAEKPELDCDLSWFTGDRKELEKQYSRLVEYDAEKIRSVANLAVAVASYILGDGVIKPQYNLLAEKASEYIANNLSETLSLSVLCKALGASKNLLYESFHSAFDCTVKEYITKKRILHALELLKNTEMSVGSIADSVGIYNHAYFSRLIIKKTGVSPLKYRKTAKV